MDDSTITYVVLGAAVVLFVSTAMVATGAAAQLADILVNVVGTRARTRCCSGCSC